MKIYNEETTKETKEFRYKPFRNVRGFLYVYNVRTWNGRTKLNKLTLPRFVLPVNETGAKVFNKLVGCLKEEFYDKLDRTPSGGLSVLQTTGNGWFVEHTKRGCTLVVLLWLDHLTKVGFRVSFESTAKINDLGITGRGAYLTMKKEFAKDGISLDDYAVENGKEIKESEIKAPMIEMGDSGVCDSTYQHAYHIDLHSAYPSGIIANYPELRPTIERIYNNRKKSEKDQKLKLTLDASIGYFQSQYCRANGHGYALTPLAKAGVNWCHDAINEIADELRSQGKWVLAFNTDGIWYVDLKGDFKSKWLGDGLGKAAIDHSNCKIRFKSKGCYEYVEDGKYHPVVRGQTRLERVKPKDKWEWGDIYDRGAEVIGFRYNERTRRIETSAPTGGFTK